MPTPEAFLEEARALGDRLARTALWDGERCTWLAAHREPGPHGGAMAYPIDASIHSGSAGVAIFLARLHEVAGDRAYARTARGAMRHAMRHAWRDEPKGSAFASRPGGEWRFGFYMGALGVAWGGMEVARLLGDPDAPARKLARDVLATRGRTPHAWDMMYGSASAIPTLLSMGDEGAALLFARDLVEAKPDLAGFSHGAAGAAWAMTLVPETRDAGRALFASVTDEPERSWCHGAPGIGLARALDSGGSSASIREAREATVGALDALLERPGESFTPCCGIAGLAECLWQMDDALGISGGLARARDIAEWGMARYEARDEWRAWPTGVTAGMHPTLLQGAAGVGHFLLRLAAPDRVPTILVPARSRALTP